MDAVAVVDGPQRSAVARLASMLERVPQLPTQLLEHFGPGVYLRQLGVFAGSCAVGAVHRTEHRAIVIGHCWLTDNAERAREYRGVNVVRSLPGAQRAIVAVTDCVVITVHPTDETDPEKLVELLTESKASELAGGADNVQLQLAGRAEVLS